MCALNQETQDHAMRPSLASIMIPRWDAAWSSPSVAARVTITTLLQKRSVRTVVEDVHQQRVSPKVRNEEETIAA